MYSSKTIKMNQITLQDLLTADTHSFVIKIQDDLFQKAYDLIPNREIFFAKDGLFSKVKRNGIVIMQGGNETEMDLDQFLNDIENCQHSCVVLLEGFAGCGKSTLVQYILCNQLKTYNFNYNFFNYDLEAQNDLIKRDKNGNIIRRSSIYEAIKKSFVQQFVFLSQSYVKIIEDFKEAICKCKQFQPFNDLYYQ